MGIPGFIIIIVSPDTLRRDVKKFQKLLQPLKFLEEIPFWQAQRKVLILVRIINIGRCTAWRFEARLWFRQLGNPKTRPRTSYLKIS